MRLRKWSVVLAALFTLVGVGLSAPAQADETTNGPVFTVMNTSESPPDGVWFRNSAHTGDTDRVTGHGVYMGERVQLRCYSWGDSVGPYNDTLWYKVLNVSRASNAGVENSGFLNAHNINDGQNANVVDAGVPNCSGAAVAPTVKLAQGPAAPAGYRYAITLDHFAAGNSVSITCFDSVRPSGFYTFTLATDSSGHAFTQGYCYSGDGPDHWVTAGGAQSNHVSWGSPSGGGGGGTGGGGTGNGGSGGGSTAGQQGTPAPTSAFYSPIDGIPSPYSSNNGRTYYQGAATSALDLEPAAWLGSPGSCSSAAAVNDLPKGGVMRTLSGWSVGRLGPLYVLADSTESFQSSIHTIVLFDPGNSTEFRDGCDSKIDVNGIIATWLNLDREKNRLIVLTGKVSEERTWYGKSTFAGLWKYYFADVWKKPAGKRVLVCDYNLLSHYKVLDYFRSAAKAPPDTCPTNSKAPKPVAWHP